MIPVIILSDGYLANGAEPWRIPQVNEIPKFPVHFATDPQGFQPYKRDPQTLSRPWAIPGTPGLEHRVGGLEKQDVTGNVNYEPLNHEKMVRLRAAKVEAIGQDVPDVVPAGDPDGDLLIVAWGSTYGSITAALKAATRGRTPHRPRSFAVSEPAAAQLGAGDGSLQQGAGPGDEYGPAFSDPSRQVSG